MMCRYFERDAKQRIPIRAHITHTQFKINDKTTNCESKNKNVMKNNNTNKNVNRTAAYMCVNWIRNNDVYVYYLYDSFTHCH